MKVLVTGGAGYIGAHTVRALLEAGHDPLVLDTLENGHRAAVPADRLVVGDAADRALVERLLRERELGAVIHFAGYIEARESAVDPGKYYRNNVGAGLALLDAMRAVGVRSIVFSSSAAVYGTPARVPIVESEPLSPLSPYAVTKAMFERILADYGRAHGTRWVALRYFNAAGAHPAGDLGEAHPTESHLIPRVLKAALGQLDGLQVFGTDYPTRDGTCIRDYIHVVDLARAHVLALEALAEGLDSAAFTVGSGEGHTVLEVIRAGEAVAERAIPWTAAPRFGGDPVALVADPTALRRTLGWEPALSDLETIVRTAWRWHRAHPPGHA